MPRELAIILFSILTVWLWRQDSKHRPKFSPALLIPLIWLLILGSRPLSWWMWFYFGIGGGFSNLDGNVVDRTFYSGLILTSIVILVRRSVTFGPIARANIGLFAFLALLGVSAVWAEFPFPTLKRWVKEVGAIPVLLLILTETNPLAALKQVFTRCAFVIFTFSVLTIKYIPEIGRSHSSFSGLPEITGIAPQKNSLGQSVAVFGLVLFWQLISAHGLTLRSLLRGPYLQWTLTLLMGAWLIYQCDSKTAMVCLGIGAVIVATPRIGLIDRRRRGVALALVLGMPVAYLADRVIDIFGPVLELLGRDATLTNRTRIWDGIMDKPVDPILGSGYLNYWDWVGFIEIEGRAVDPVTAHNGYLEIYLDGGFVGLAFLALMLLHTGILNARAYITRNPIGSLAFAFFAMTLLMNISESVFARRGTLWSSFLLTALAVGSWHQLAANLREPEDDSWESESDLTQTRS